VTSLRFASLGSGSRGNALLVEFDDTLLMIDCGLPRRIVEQRLKALGRDPRDVTAILVTHEHADHAQGVAKFARRYNTPVWMTPGTASVVRGAGRTWLMSCHRELTIESISVEPYLVPHEARELCQLVFAAGGRRLGVMTDTGHITPHICERLARCDALAIECNHDLESLQRGPYPEALKARIASRFGHLNNAQTTELLDRVEHAGLQWVMALHLSEQNNSPAHVRAALDRSPDRARYRLHLATQDTPSAWIAVD
jgi:phosphoribosyl 1,2-cyclic phosphodiesterase